ncbi:signal peptidase I SipW [Paenibacillus sp. CN-4]|uniref:signal peptidase I SipW n=1 Tax=Paenibacillus nanchangensis TaxID=3348343 RepID=UPI0039781D16
MAQVKLWSGRILTALLSLIFFITVVAVVISKASGGEPSFFGYQIKTVLSGSMEPGIHTGSIVALEPGGDMTRFQPGDVITFLNEENLLVTHRVIEAERNEATGEAVYRTKGDNNDAPDVAPVSSRNVVAEYKGITIPYVGYAMNFAASKTGSVLLMIVPGAMLLIYALYTSWKAVSELEKKHADLSQPSPEGLK